LEKDFAAILLDVQMPEMDGFETAALIRKRRQTKNTPIIFITAESQTNETMFKGYGMGAVDFLFKPIVPDILRTKVWGDENHQKTGFKLIPFLFLIIQAEQK